MMHTFFRGKDGVMLKRWDKETKEKTVRLVIDHRSDYSSECPAITTVSFRLGMSPEMLRIWVLSSALFIKKQLFDLRVFGSTF